ncbi:hypothetical protein PPL_07435 [Heterostelium album PN500]|uniref:EGF-like domain-containing protein n=1 Tax=Heterostelium pallidum (strain ATCC 26659 / Pp 5 / PN500) TaxID=670386 RepID=D3BFY4_HETP5|nr:hypothetical protein PPL_07435 [Heterostelium album PN500]EFA79744.1 hypothetical protein PPL_07435 [Heterostelium album PN500]|eukprot:XP_020431865.1 hypothetical protein PPL_07435 [Heterostelium album PN500]
MEDPSHTCYNTISVAFDSDVLLDKTKFSIPITSTDSKALSLKSSIQTVLSTQSFYFSIQTISNTENLPINISLQYQDTQTFDFPNITSLVCNIVKAEDFKVVKVSNLSLWNPLTMYFQIDFGFNFTGLPLFQPFQGLSCQAPPFLCFPMPTTRANQFAVSLSLDLGYQSIPSSTGIIKFTYIDLELTIPAMDTIFPWNITNELNLIRNIRYFPPNNTNYIETFSFQAKYLNQILMFDSPLLKSSILYRYDNKYTSTSGNNIALMYQNNQNGASYLSGLGAQASETRYFMCGGKTEQFFQLGMNFTMLDVKLISFGMVNKTNPTDISVARTEFTVDYVRDYQISTVFVPTLNFVLKYPSVYANSQFKYSTEIPYPNQYRGSISSQLPDFQSMSSVNVQSLFTDAWVFEILDFQMTKVSSFTFIIRISLSTNYEILQLTMKSTPQKWYLLEGTPFNGTYELSIYSPISIVFPFSFRNTRGEIYNLYSSQFYNNNLNSTNSYLLINTTDILSLDDFSYIGFRRTTMDLSRNEFSNTLFFNLTRPLSGILDYVFVFNDPTNYSPKFKTKFDINKNLYCINFNVSSKDVDGPVRFILSNYQNMIYSFDLSNFTVNIINSTSHSYQPEITSIKAFPSTSINTNGRNQFQLGWNVTILNEPLGFTFGTFEIISNLDSLPRVIKVNEFNRINGNAQNGTYTVYTTIATKCTSQNFTIRSISLTDGVLQYNPLSTIIGTPDESELIISLICPTNLDTTPPVITDFSVTPSVKVYSMERRVEFNLSISDGTGSGISSRHLPYLLLASENGDTMEIPSLSFSYFDGISATLNGYSDLPYGFGFNNITISIYGIVDNRLNYASYLTSDLLSIGKTYRIFRDSSVVYPYLASSTPTLSLGGPMGLFGAGFSSYKLGISVLVDFKDGKNFQLIDTDYLSGVYLNVTLPRFFQSSIDVQIIRNGLSSNILTVDVSDYYQEPTPTPTPTPNITTTPNTKTCPGNPICNNKGKCNLQTLVCECIPMWYGPSCASEIIIIPTPTPQPQPTSETTYVFDSNNITSVVQVIAVRELNDIYNVVNEYQISNWTLTIADPKLITIPTYYYQTQLGNTSTTLNVTIEFFSNQTERQFGGQNITLSPSSIKFSISIGRYQFQSKTNYLQVIMAATIQGSDGSCSSKSIGSGNDNNVRWIKMNIDKTSLYGRFITYGIIDGNVELIQNMLIEDNNETETSQTRTTKVGITIPNFDDSVLLDPDFSNLIDVNNDSNENEICQSKKKLSNGAIAGIVVGCVVAIAIVVGVTLYLRKRAKYNREKLKMSQKLQKMNNKAN